jgi:hypothetical protein
VHPLVKLVLGLTAILLVVVIVAILAVAFQPQTIQTF